MDQEDPMPPVPREVLSVQHCLQGLSFLGDLQTLLAQRAPQAPLSLGFQGHPEGPGARQALVPRARLESLAALEAPPGQHHLYHL